MFAVNLTPRPGNEIARVIALHHAALRDGRQRVRHLADGGLDAAQWTLGLAREAPVSKKAVPGLDLQHVLDEILHTGAQLDEPNVDDATHFRWNGALHWMTWWIGSPGAARWWVNPEHRSDDAHAQSILGTSAMTGRMGCVVPVLGPARFVLMTHDQAARMIRDEVGPSPDRTPIDRHVEAWVGGDSIDDGSPVNERVTRERDRLLVANGRKPLASPLRGTVVLVGVDHDNGASPVDLPMEWQAALLAAGRLGWVS